MLYVIIAIPAVVIIYSIIAYNQLVSLRNLVREAWSGVDVQLKRRYNLIPNLSETVKGYSGFEKSVLEEVTKMRAKAEGADSITKQAGAENNLTGSLKRIFAIVENYPDLKASGAYIKLMENLVEIEDQIQYSRRYYNGAVRNLNTAIETFPAMIVANMFKFRQSEFFEIELSTERKAPTVGDVI